MTYLILKYAHVVSAIATISGFLLRGFWMLTESPLLQHRVARIAPHIVDTVFLLSGIAMLWMLHLNPLTQGMVAGEVHRADRVRLTGNHRHQARPDQTDSYDRPRRGRLSIRLYWWRRARQVPLSWLSYFAG